MPSSVEVVVFEDPFVPRLYPITIGRPSYNISCGSYRLVDWLRALGLPLKGFVRPHLEEIQRLDFPDLSGEGRPLGSSRAVLLVNARLVPSVSAFHMLRKILEVGRPGVVRNGDAVAAALFNPPPRGETPPDAGNIERYLQQLALTELEPLEAPLPLLDYPHDVVRYNQQILVANLQYRLEKGQYREIAEGVFAAPGAVLGPHVVSDTQQGPILLDENARIGPYCLLSGPGYLGPSARVIEHAAIKDAVSIGHTTKIGGEVEASVIEPYTNKQHHGFLGHSYLGSWINLGAGTCNSDLKNTYGQVKMEYRGEKVATGMQFLGCIMGDYAKSAINTGIFTGKTIGACSMLYGFVTTNVPSFVNYARLFGQVTELPTEVMIASQERMFQRRQVRQRPCDIELLHVMYELTREDRQLADEPLSL